MVLQVPEVDRTPRQAVPGVILRLLQASDVEALGELMWEAYRGTIDDEYRVGFPPFDGHLDRGPAGPRRGCLPCRGRGSPTPRRIGMRPLGW